MICENSTMPNSPSVFYETTLGRIILGDSLTVLKETEDQSIDLIMTSPPFGLVRKKEYGNFSADKYSSPIPDVEFLNTSLLCQN